MGIEVRKVMLGERTARFKPTPETFIIPDLQTCSFIPNFNTKKCTYKCLKLCKNQQKLCKSVINWKTVSYDQWWKKLAMFNNLTFQYRKKAAMNKSLINSEMEVNQI